jgi:nitroimidazol reductase NimA-like FMN-containing flavoprotein (pyridoxamine 5'-phosphate oxidase superfamily)
MPIPRRLLRLTPEELDELLATERTLHLATVGPDGTPHVAPMWFVWHDGALWLSSLRRSRRTRDLAAGSPVAACVDAGLDYGELRGAVLYGRPEEATGDERLAAIREAFARKYWGGTWMPEVRSHVWLRMVPDRIVSWDFRKIPVGRDPRLRSSATDGGQGG